MNQNGRKSSSAVDDDEGFGCWTWCPPHRAWYWPKTLKRLVAYIVFIVVAYFMIDFFKKVDNPGKAPHVYTPVAHCLLQQSDTISGLLTFRWDGVGTTVTGEVLGLEPGSVHGLHIHNFGDMSDGCTSMGPHFNPHGSPHGAPANRWQERHVGDLGNVVADSDGVAQVALRDRQVWMYGKNSIVGRGVVLHAGPDDMGLGGSEASVASGDAGARLACCSLVIVNDG